MIDLLPMRRTSVLLMFSLKKAAFDLSQMQKAVGRRVMVGLLDR